MKLLGMGKSGKGPVSAAAGVTGTPEPDTKVRLRIAVSHGGGPGEDIICELPSVVRVVHQPTSAGGRTVVTITAADLTFLPGPLDTTAEHALIWGTQGGQMEMPVLLPDAAGTRWELEVTGPPRRVQRRQFVRVEVKLAATVAMFSGEQPQQWDGTIVDLGEGGVRCLVEAEPPAAGSRISVTFSADDSTVLECAGVVVRHLPVEPEGCGTTALAVRFDDPEEHGDAIRRMVFAEQLRVRQLRAGVDAD
jgi:PilZ domain